MSSCKKWNSCNNNCKRSGSNRGGGGGGNGVIGKDGATGPTGPAGLQGPTGPAPSGLNGMIPYEPYNQNNAAHETEGRGSIQLKSNDTTTYIQFTAPSTGYYTKARMLTNDIAGNNDISGNAIIQVRMGVYDNSENYAPLFPVPPSGAAGNQGIPYNILGQGVLNITPPHSNWSFRFLDISLNPPVHLKMNENYWFAYSTHNSLDLSSNIFTIANNYFFIPPSNQIQNGNRLSVLDISDNNTKGGPAGGGDASMNSITDLSGAPLRPSPNATWFRLYDPSASFIVGPTGDCGCTGAIGATGATGATGPTGAAASAFKSYDYGVHVMPSTALDASKVILGMDSLISAGGAIALSNTSMTVTLTPTIDVLGWIYPSYGGIAQFVRNPGLLASNVNQPWPNSKRNLNWSDRSSFPTGSWYGGSEGASLDQVGYADAIGRSIDTNFTIDANSIFSWMWGPYDGGSVVGPMELGRKMSLYIVYIPCEGSVPLDRRDWQWINLVFTSDDQLRCGCASLGKLNAQVGIGLPNEVAPGPNPGYPVPIGTVSPNTIEVECGGSLGICIGSNDINYTNTCSATSQPFLISPATFSLKVKQT